MTEDRYRLVVLGSAKVGKTSIIRRYLYKEFTDKYKETVEDIHSRVFRIQGLPLHLDILDTNFNYPEMRKIAITSASAFMFVFSVDDVRSFKDMSDLWQEVAEHRQDVKTIPVVVIGNKTDLPSKKIYEATATAFTKCLSGEVRYIEASAKNDARVTEIFKTLLDLSGYPKCKAGGGKLEDPFEVKHEDIALRRVNTVKARPTNREMYAARMELKSADERTPSENSSNTSLGIPLISDFKRNRSLRMKSPRREKEQLERKTSDEGKLSRSSSLIRRTKHLSLKMRRHGEKNPEELEKDDSDCVIS